MIEAENVSKSFTDVGNQVRLFHNLSFKIKRGESVALMGQSGAGKSTLLHLIGGFEAADSGRIVLKGECINGMSDAQLSRFRRSHLSMVFQDFNLIPSLNAEDNILFGRRLNGMVAEDEFTRELIGVLNLNHRRQHYPSQLSGGEQQRVAIARALASRPEILLADEPTGNLDEKTSAEVMRQFMAAVELQQSTLLLVTHSRETASYLGQVWSLQQGALRC